MHRTDAIAGVPLCAPACWCSNNRPQECSDFTVGLAVLNSVLFKPTATFSAIRQATEEAGGEWG